MIHNTHQSIWVQQGVRDRIARLAIAVGALCALCVAGCNDASRMQSTDAGPLPIGDAGKGDAADADQTCRAQTCTSIDASCGTHGDGCGGWLHCGGCSAPEICGGGGDHKQCGGSVPWFKNHIIYRVDGNIVGSYDWPLRTLWDASKGGWDAAGTDYETFSPGHVSEWDCAMGSSPWKSTAAPKGSLDPHSPQPMPWGQNDVKEGLAMWHAWSGGKKTRFHNSWDSIVSDGSSKDIQVVLTHFTGRPPIGSDMPGCRKTDLNPGGDQQTLGQAVFAVALPPHFNASRAMKYPIFLNNPGSGANDKNLALGSLLNLEGGLMPLLVGQSTESGGTGVIGLWGNAGASPGGNSINYRIALNEMMDFLKIQANADLDRVVAAGVSRGGSMTLLDGSWVSPQPSVRQSELNFTLVAGFATAPMIRPSMFRLQGVLPVHGSEVGQMCWVDPDCANAWRWDHEPDPYGDPDYSMAIWENQTDVARLDKTAEGFPSSFVEYMRSGTFIEICGGAGDIVTFGATAEEYVDDLPKGVKARLDYYLRAGHQPLQRHCTWHATLYVLDKLAGRDDYAGLFDATVKTGKYFHRVKESVLDEATNNAWALVSLGDDPSHFEALNPSAGCDSRPPVVLSTQYRVQDTMVAHEPLGFHLSGQTHSRKWRVELRKASDTSVLVRSWIFEPGNPLPAGCSHAPDVDYGVYCRSQASLAACGGECRWNLLFDCDDDGVRDAINMTDNSRDRTSYPIATKLITQDTQCLSLFPNSFPGNDDDPLFCVPHDPMLTYGIPLHASPCLNDGDTNCTFAKRVFVTSSTYDGALGGLAGADAQCASTAAAGGLEGTYKAWLSTSTTSALDRLAHHPGPYVLVDGQKVADSWTQLIAVVDNVSLYRAIHKDENGAPVPAGQAWTGTHADGSAQAPSCSDWTSTDDSGRVGQTDSPGPSWTESSVAACSDKQRLYCFEQ